MLIYPKINPIAIQIASFKVYWYGIMYMLSFMWFAIAAKLRIKKYPHEFLNNKLIDDLLFYAAIGVIVGGRLGYCFFYQTEFYINHPIDILKTWQGGMSFHGGLIGVLLAIYLFARYHKQNFFVIADFVAMFIPVCLLLGRLGNFINAELPGRFVSNPHLWWATIYPNSGSLLPRHPSSVYEMLGEGVLLSIILFYYANKERRVSSISGVFLLSYGVIRFILEYFRMPDSFLSDLVNEFGISMGQILSTPMIILGLIVLYYSKFQTIRKI